MRVPHNRPLRRALAILVAGLVGSGLFAAPSATAKGGGPKPGKVHPFTTEKHARAWSLFVPSKYSKKKSWPLVISSHGRGGSGAGEMRPWQSLANRHGFIVACPDMVTATHNRPKKSNLPASQEDDEVLMEIFETVASQFNVNRRAVMITGFSGGGNPSYHTGLRHPEVFTHICTRGGNFAPQQMPPAETVARGKSRLQIYIFFGEKDHVLIIGNPDGTGQAYAARDALKKAGYEHVSFEKVPAMKHESRPAKAAQWLADYLESNKKRFKEADKRDALLAKARVAIEKQHYRDALKLVTKARAIETKQSLQEDAVELRKQITDAGHQQLADAKALHDEGATEAGVKILKQVVREFRALEDLCKEAKTLLDTWADGGR